MLILNNHLILRCRVRRLIKVRRQIEELLHNGFIRPSISPMASPIVAVLKGPSGKNGVRLAIDYRFVNLHSQGDAFGNSFCRCVQNIIQPIHDFCFSFVDDMSVCSETWSQHILHLRSFLTEIHNSGLTLSLK